MRRVSVKFDVKIQSEDSKKYDKPYLISNVDICKKINFGNYIILFLMSNLEKYSNMKFECPVKASNYYAYNFPAPQSFTNLPPAVMRTLYAKWKLTLTITGKSSKTEPSRRVALVSIRGETCEA